MRALRGVIVLVLALALSAPVLAADYQAGEEAYDRGDYATALKEWRPLAKQGDADGQYGLGILYRYGNGVPRNRAEGARWLRLAAEQGNSAAQRTLGDLYYIGRGVPKDYVLAHMWYNLAVARLPRGRTFDNTVFLRDVVESYMTPEQIAEAQRLAREWKPK